MQKWTTPYLSPTYTMEAAKKEDRSKYNRMPRLVNPRGKHYVERIFISRIHELLYFYGNTGQPEDWTSVAIKRLHSPDGSFDSRWNSNLSMLQWLDSKTQKKKVLLTGNFITIIIFQQLIEYSGNI